MKWNIASALATAAASVLFMAQAVMSAEQPILFGGSISRDGTYAEPAAMIQKGYMLWEREVNQKGGLLGRQVKLIFVNDHSDVPKASSIYEDLILEHRVDMLLAPYSTALTLAASKVCEAHDHVLVASGASGTKIWNRGSGWVFGTYALARRYFIGFLDLIARQGRTEVSVLYENNLFNRDAALGVREWAPKFGLELNGWKAFDPGSDDTGLIWSNVRSWSSQALVICSYPPSGYRFLDLMHSTSSKPVALAMTITPVHPDFYRRAGTIAEHVYAPSQWEPDERIPFPGTERFIRSFERLFGQQPSYHAGSAYAACQVLEKAIASKQSLEQEQIRDYIRSMDTVTVIGRFKVDHTGKQVGHNPLIIQWQKGRKEIVSPPHLRTARPLSPSPRGTQP